MPLGCVWRSMKRDAGKTWPSSTHSAVALVLPNGSTLQRCGTRVKDENARKNARAAGRGWAMCPGYTWSWLSWDASGLLSRSDAIPKVC